MTSRQFSRPGRKVLRRTRVLRDGQFSNVWSKAFFSLCLLAAGVYFLSFTLAR